MEISIAVQTVVFLKAILLGVGLSIIYDFIRAFRHQKRAGVLLTAVCDSVFWLVTLFGLFLFVLTSANGEGRFYILLGAGLGALLYFIAFSEWMLKIMKIILKLAGRIVETVAFLWKQTKALGAKAKKAGTKYKKIPKN